MEIFSLIEIPALLCVCIIACVFWVFIRDRNYLNMKLPIFFTFGFIVLLVLYIVGVLLNNNFVWKIIESPINFYIITIGIVVAAILIDIIIYFWNERKNKGEFFGDINSGLGEISKENEKWN